MPDASQDVYDPMPQTVTLPDGRVCTVGLSLHETIWNEAVRALYAAGFELATDESVGTRDGMSVWALVPLTE